MSAHSLTVAPTQNTAPVHEYQCLYTRDLHKKAKKWHDGSLRFHTFNQRVMVYDDSKNFIGDLHYRDTEPFQEGVEVQLDRGVKVEVGQRSGQSETDISTILEKNRTETPAKRSKLLSIQTSQRPKSLIEVLGASQRRNGRSRVLPQSPFEQRQSLNLHDSTAHPAKRPRLSSEKENHNQNNVNANKIPGPVGTPQVLQPALVASAMLSSRLPQRSVPASSISFEEVIDVPSDEDVPSRAQSSGQISHVPQAISEAPTTAQSRSEETGTKPKLQAKSVRKEKVAKLTVKNPKNRSKKTQERPISGPSRVSVPPRSPGTRFARLLLGQLQPRQKLTYVLPGSPGPLFSRRASLTSTSSSNHPQGSVHSPIQINTSSPELGTSADSACQIELFTHGTTKEEIPKCSPLLVENEARCSSPLFVPEDHPNTRSPSPALFQTPKISSPGIIGAPTSTSSNETRGRDSIMQNPRKNSTETSCQIMAGFEMSQSQPEPDVSAKLLPQEVSLAFPRAHSPKRLRRAFSASNTFEDDGPSQDLADNIVPRSPLMILENLSSNRSPAKGKSPAKLSRCASDTTAMNTHTIVSGQHQVMSIPKGETGPWTSEESFVLFDWWPPELEKPDLWKATPKLVQPTKSIPHIPDFSTRITTARQLLNDIR